MFFLSISSRRMFSNKASIHASRSSSEFAHSICLIVPDDPSRFCSNIRNAWRYELSAISGLAGAACLPSCALVSLMAPRYAPPFYMRKVLVSWYLSLHDTQRIKKGRKLTDSKYSKTSPLITKYRIFHPPKFLPRLIRYPALFFDFFCSSRSRISVVKNSHTSSRFTFGDAITCCRYCSKTI